MKRTEFIAGVRAELPILLGVIPFGLIFGVLAIGAGLSPTLAQAMSFIVFAGSAQFIAIPLLGAGVPTAVLSAIILPELLQPGGTLDISLGNTRLLAGLIAALVAWRTQNILATIVAGMGALWILELIT